MIISHGHLYAGGQAQGVRGGGRPPGNLGFSRTSSCDFRVRGESPSLSRRELLSISGEILRYYIAWQLNATVRVHITNLMVDDVMGSFNGIKH